MKENNKVPLEPVDAAEDQPNTLMKRSSDDPEIKAHAEEVKKMLPMLDLDPETHKPYKPSHVIAARVSNPQIEEKLVQFRKLLRLQKNTEASKLNKEIERMKSEEAEKQNAELDRQYEEALANWKKEYPQYQ